MRIQKSLQSCFWAKKLCKTLFLEYIILTRAGLIVVGSCNFLKNSFPQQDPQISLQTRPFNILIVLKWLKLFDTYKNYKKGIFCILILSFTLKIIRFENPSSLGTPQELEKPRRFFALISAPSNKLFHILVYLKRDE